MGHVIRPEKAKGQCLGISLFFNRKMDFPQVCDKVVNADETEETSLSLDTLISTQTNKQTIASHSLFHNLPKPFLITRYRRIELIINGLQHLGLLKTGLRKRTGEKRNRRICCQNPLRIRLLGYKGRWWSNCQAILNCPILDSRHQMCLLRGVQVRGIA